VSGRVPGLDRELAHHGAGRTVVGIDEVGKGAWAGPLVVGAAVLPASVHVDGLPVPVRDSKAMTAMAREAAAGPLAEWCETWALGWASASECDLLGMAAAQRLACRRALEGLAVRPDVAVTDGRWDFVSPLVDRVEMVVGGDGECASVAVASVLAKVARDAHLRSLAIDMPHWSFETNKGYPCPRHRAGLAAFGPSVEHRTTWSFMETAVPWPGAVRRRRADAAPTLFDP
jgi:ribonuclease HII